MIDFLKKFWYLAAIWVLLVVVVLLLGRRTPDKTGQIISSRERRQLVRDDKKLAAQQHEDTTAANHLDQTTHDLTAKGDVLAARAQQARLQTHHRPTPTAHAQAPTRTVYPDTAIARLQSVLTRYANQPDPSAGKAGNRQLEHAAQSPN